MRAFLGILLTILISSHAVAEGAVVLARDPGGSYVVQIIVGKRTFKAVYDEYERLCADNRYHDCELKKTFNRSCAAAAYSRKGVAWAFGNSIPDAERGALAQCNRTYGQCVSGNKSDCDWLPEMTLLCTDPIFIERQRLRSQAVRDASRLQFVSNAIRYLEGTYCAYAAKAPAEDRPRGQTSFSTCTVATGMHVGERVYWEVCDAAE
jgi:hypothetical protein